MSERLFNPGPRAEEFLTERQRKVLEMVRTTPGGVTDVQAGAALSGLPSRWQADSGRTILARLRHLGYGLVRRQATGLWEIPGVTPKPGHLGPGELPEGF